MARINIEDDIESRQEFWNLLEIVKDRDACLGKLLRFFRLAQKINGKGKPISKEELEDHGLVCMIASKWAIPWNDGFKAIGADKQFAWYQQKVTAGRAGGHKKQENVQKNLADARSRVASDMRELAHAYPLALAPSLNNKIYIPRSCPKNGQPAPSAPEFDFESLYKKYPLKLGKKRGMKTCRSQIKTEEDFQKLDYAIQRYRDFCDAEKRDKKYIKHFSTFMNEWEDWLDPNHGETNKRECPAPAWPL